ncbi:MAG: transporter substrate-binding protein [Peptococcaceae bacterium]|jgi:tripartite ATP-independent transporter DctP family solute receptor|nr:transporter substrate-binding protein [Peptococcaceae bacterium]
MRKWGIALLVLLLSLSLVLAGCGGSKPAPEAKKPEAPKTIKIVAAHVTPKDGVYQKGMEKFKEIVEKESNGTMTVEIHPNGELGGNEDQLVQKMQTGTVDLIVASPGFMAQTVKEIDLFSLLYLFKGWDHWAKVMDGEVGQKMTKIVEDKTDFKVLGYWTCGVREYFGSKPVTKPEDLKNMKIRVQNSPAIKDTWVAFGAQPASVAFNELYQALQNKVVDAAENDPVNIFQMKFHEVSPYISLTNHDVATRLFLMSDKKFQSLSDEQKKIIEKAAVEATKEERKVDRQFFDDYLAKLKAAGAKVNEVDTAPFIKATEPIRAKYAKDLGLEDFLKKISEQ